MRSLWKRLVVVLLGLGVTPIGAASPQWLPLEVPGEVGEPAVIRKIAASRDAIYALMSDGAIWTRPERASAWSPLPRPAGAGHILNIAVTGNQLIAADGKLWRWSEPDGRWYPIEVGGGVNTWWTLQPLNPGIFAHYRWNGNSDNSTLASSPDGVTWSVRPAVCNDMSPVSCPGGILSFDHTGVLRLHGGDWQRLDASPPAVQSLHCTSASILVRRHDHFEVSKDQGATFQAATGFDPAFIGRSFLELDGLIVVPTEIGVARSLDGGLSWQYITGLLRASTTGVSVAATRSLLVVQRQGSLWTIPLEQVRGELGQAGKASYRDDVLPHAFTEAGFTVVDYQDYEQAGVHGRLWRLEKAGVASTFGVFHGGKWEARAQAATESIAAAKGITDGKDGYAFAAAVPGDRAAGESLLRPVMSPPGYPMDVVRRLLRSRLAASVPEPQLVREHDLDGGGFEAFRVVPPGPGTLHDPGTLIFIGQDEHLFEGREGFVAQLRGMSVGRFTYQIAARSFAHRFLRIEVGGQHLAEGPDEQEMPIAPLRRMLQRTYEPRQQSSPRGTRFRFWSVADDANLKVQWDVLVSRMGEVTYTSRRYEGESFKARLFLRFLD